MAARKKVAMVAPVPTKPAKKPANVGSEIVRLGGGRPFVIVDEKSDFILVMFLGDSKPTKIIK